MAKKGNINIGEKQTKASIKKGTAKLVVMANNCQYADAINTLAAEHNVPVYNYTSTGVNLGYTCGKSFAVSSFAVIDEGESNILSLVKKRK